MSSHTSIRFDRFCLDLATAQVRRDDTVLPLTPKAVAVLHYLLMHPQQVVTKHDIRQAVWPETGGSEAALKVCVSELRKALGDSATTAQFIETQQGQGYRFIGKVVSPQAVADSREDERQRATRYGQLPTLLTQHSALSTQHLALVGREVERAQLHERWGKALHGERQVVFLSGEPGIGKTALVEAFLAGLRQQATGNGQQGTGAESQGETEMSPPMPDARSLMPVLWIGHGQCIEQYGAGEPYLPVLEALGRLGRGPDGEQIIATLAQYAVTWLAQMPALVNPAEFEALQRMVQGASRERMLREMVDALEVLSTRNPLILVLEDLHWSDQSTLELLAYLARRRDPARLLILGTYRPLEGLASGRPLRTVVQELQGREHSTELRLKLLSEPEVTAYVTHRFPTLTVPQQLPAALHRRTEGNPLFMVTVVEQLVREGVIAETAGQWQVNKDITLIEQKTPESVRHGIERQCASFSADTQQMLAVASVVGVEFSVAAISVGAGQPVELVEEHCAALAAKGQFLRTAGIEEWPDGTLGGRYRFLHALYQNVLYEQLAEMQRVRLHRRIGERKAAAYGDRTGEIAAELAMHFEAGRDHQRAVEYLTRAGENALQRSAHVEAISHLTKALAILTTLPDSPQRQQQELRLQVTLGSPLVATKGYAAPEVEATYLRASALCQQVPETPYLFPALWGLWAVYAVRPVHGKALELGEQLLVLTQQRQDASTRVQAHWAVGQPLLYMGHFQQAQEQFEHGSALYQMQPRDQPQAPVARAGQDPGVNCLAMAARALWALGYPDQALQKSHEALALARELRHPLSIGFALTMVAVAHQLRREGREAQEKAEAAIALCREHGFSFYLASGTIWQGWGLAQQGQTIEGVARLQHGLAAWHATGAEIALSHYLAGLADAYQRGGHIEESLTAVTEGLFLATKNEEHFYESELYRLKGELLLQKGMRDWGAGVGQEAPPPSSPTPSTQPLAPNLQRSSVFRREGDLWTLAFDGVACQIKENRGLVYLAHLLREPHREFHVLALAAHVSPESSTMMSSAETSSGGQLHVATKQRLAELREELEEAQEFHDQGRIEWLQDEIAVLSDDLMDAMGLGEHAAAENVEAERARVNISRAIKVAIKKIDECHPALGRHLAHTIKTGTYCSYTPDSRLQMAWQV